MSFTTADLCDTFEADLGNSVHVVAPMFQCYGSRRAFGGQIVTVKVFEDNSLVRVGLGESGRGKVLVVDGGGSLRCALLGDQLALLAHGSGWEGVIIHGCIRDSAVINTIDIGVRALATHPKKSVKKNVGDRNVVVTFGGVSFRPDDYLYADADGILVSDKPLT